MTVWWYSPLNCDVLQVLMDLQHYMLYYTSLQNTEKVSIKHQETHVLCNCDPATQPHSTATFHALQADALLGMQAWFGCLHLLTGLA